jgi:hypothetical protein
VYPLRRPSSTSVADGSSFTSSSSSVTQYAAVTISALLRHPSQFPPLPDIEIQVRLCGCVDTSMFVSVCVYVSVFCVCVCGCVCVDVFVFVFCVFFLSHISLCLSSLLSLYGLISKKTRSRSIFLELFSTHSLSLKHCSHSNTLTWSLHADPPTLLALSLS